MLFLLLILTTYRLTRFIVLDDFPPIRYLRERAIGEDGNRLSDTRLGWLGELLGCHWCVSVWISAGVVSVAQAVTGDVPYPLLSWPACAAGGALILHREDG